MNIKDAGWLPPSTGGRTSDWDESLASSVIGKIVVVGITALDSMENVIERFQLVGQISSASPWDGICLQLKEQGEGESFMLPPDLSSLVHAPAGIYKLRGSSVSVENPDFTCTMEVHMRGQSQ